MAITNISDLAGFLKPVFGSLQNLIPETAILQEKVKFDVANKVGKYFQEPLVVRTSWGVTFLGTDGTGAGGGSDLVPAIPSKTASLEVTPTMIVLRDQSNYTLMDRSPGDASSKQAFMSDASLIAETLTVQMRNIIEIGCLCGQTGVFTVASYNGGTDVCTITAASLRPGFLSTLEAATVDFFETDLTTLRTDATAGAALLSVSAVDVEAGTFSLAVAPDTDPQPGDVVFIHGANAGSGSFQEMVGLRKQISDTTSTIFGIPKPSYSLYRGNVVNSVGPMTAGALLGLAAKAANRGFIGQMIAVMSPKAYESLNSRLISQQVFDSSYSETKQAMGSAKIQIDAQNGIKIEPVAHPFQAAAEVMLLPVEYLKRIGSAYENSTPDNAKDITFEVPGSDYQYLSKVQDKAAVEMQIRTDQQIIDTRPAWSVLGLGVTFPT